MLLLSFFIFVVFGLISFGFAVANREKHRKKIIITSSISIFFMLVGFISAKYDDGSQRNNYSSGYESNNTKSKSEVKKIENTRNESDKQENKNSEEISEHRDTNLKGRGDPEVQGSRTEPNYKNVIGYVVVDKDDFKMNSQFLLQDFPHEPWLVKASYSKSNSDYTEEKAIQNLEHKTEVVVKDQMLTHKGFGVYVGKLLVERLSDRAKFYINVKNFVTKPYWNYNLVSAAEVGCYIAENLNDGTSVLVVERGKYGNYNGVVGYSWKDNAQKIGNKTYGRFVRQGFKPEQLKIIY